MSKKYGFTIIEVVLVLAIAGLISVGVFVGIPALQRSQRDTQRKNDAARVFNAALEYIELNGEAPFYVKCERENGRCKSGGYTSPELGDTMDLDFIPKYVDKSCVLKDNNPRNKNYTGETTAQNIYGYIGQYGDRAYKFEGCGDNFRDPSGEIYSLTVLDGDGSGFRPGEETKNRMWVTAGSKCTGDESVRKATYKPNDILVFVKLENGTTYCIDNHSS